jgi:hypothetical protein
MRLELPQRHLRRSMRRLELSERGYGPQLDVVRRVGDEILRKRGISKLDREQITIEPDRCILAS